MLQYLQWFLSGFDTVLNPSDMAIVYMALAIAIPIIMTLAAVVAMIWAVFGLFGSRR